MVGTAGAPNWDSAVVIASRAVWSVPPSRSTICTALTTANDPSARAHAADVLCFIGAPGAHEAAPALADALHDDHPDVRLAATLALRELVDYPAARKALLEVSHNSDDSRVRTVARLSL